MAVSSFESLVARLLRDDDWPPPVDCPWYRKGFCAIDGALCPYSDITYSECPKFIMASGHPEAVEPVLD